jgi:lysophospholipase L1-like esterase
MPSGRLRHLLEGLAVGLVATVLVLGVGEAGLRATYAVRNSLVTAIPLPYVIDHDYGPSPPWGERVRLFERDQALIWRNRPGIRRRYVDVFTPVQAEADRIAIFRRFSPTLPASLTSNPVWEIALNSRGFRGPEFEVAKPHSRFRVVCLGDSWTFGTNVAQDDAYPSKLESLLRQAFPAADVEVLNLGVPGYTSFQGLELVRQLGLSLDPDVVLIGFGMNDSSMAGFRDRDLAGMRHEPGAWTTRLTGLAERSEVFRLLRHVALVMRHRPKSIGDLIKETDARIADPAARQWTATQYGRTEPWPRVPLRDYEENLAQMVTLARSRGALAVLLFNELWAESPYRTAAARLAHDLGVPFVDSHELVARARRQVETDLERALGLDADRSARDRGPTGASAAAGDEVEVVFRVHANGHPVPRAISIVGADAALGSLVPNRTSMRDDGSHGDQRAGDGVWSYAARLAPGTQRAYVYTNSGAEGRWEGLDVPALRTLAVEPPGGRTLYRPIEMFGKLPLQSDSWHTDRQGHALIAQAVFDILGEDPHVRRRVQQRGGQHAAHP